MSRGSIRVDIPHEQLQTALQKKLLQLVDKDVARRNTNEIFLEMCNKYVPEDSGTLKSSAYATERSVIWSTPYAHYMYEGIVYGPNFLVEIDGQLVWRSPAGKPKFPTNRTFQYQNPNATAHWDKTMLERDRRAFNNRVTAMLKRLAKE
jgi:hypothetical protein